ncbi:hypothetical protein M422DRAFT_261848 [Sphaerobolus stellatus SS14]|uniref:Uncharacterized protein n=1 Tax=Sphaerobolus stellatus (strain SS14) TaxID=990650 RepID=A0A0C9V2N0_SPHS4|nr:hypothetical protein M422DRAFT_261848 [Sphaerobolus stellatus SS14]
MAVEIHRTLIHTPPFLPAARPPRPITTTATLRSQPRGNEEAEEQTMNRRNRPRAKNRRREDIPVVKDATGEKVMGSFELFLKNLTDDEDPELMYIEQIHTKKECDFTTLYVDYTDPPAG